MLAFEPIRLILPLYFSRIATEIILEIFISSFRGTYYHTFIFLLLHVNLLQRCWMILWLLNFSGVLILLYFLRIWFSLSSFQFSYFYFSYVLNPVEGNQTVPLPKHKNMHVQIFQCFHSVPCVGYGFLEKRKKVNFASSLFFSNEMVYSWKKNLSENLEKNWEFCENKELNLTSIMTAICSYILATLQMKYFKVKEKGKRIYRKLISNLGNEDAIFSYPLIFVECTFLGKNNEEEERNRAEKTKHIFWPNLKPHVLAHPRTYFVLIHFSLRYSSEEIRDFFEKESLTNVLPWVASQNCLVEKAIVMEEEEWEEGRNRNLFYLIELQRK